jgi:signal transduction histidine kinase
MRVPGGPIIVDGDAVRLAQVFSNLLDNASRYTPLGGSIALDVTVLDKTTTITVSDNGIGITPDAVPVVFDLFPQTSGAPAEQGGGPGIGLAVVRQLVEAHGGTVVARSAGRHQGSEFVVTLPMDKKGDVV